MARLVVPHEGHELMVTETVFGRAWFDCSCGVSRVFPLKREATRAALLHHHDVGGCNCPPQVRAHPWHPDPPTNSGASCVATPAAGSTAPPRAQRGPATPNTHP